MSPLIDWAHAEHDSWIIYTSSTEIPICICVILQCSSSLNFNQSINHTCILWVGVGGFSKVVATFNHVGGSFNLFMVTTGDVWIIPSFRIWDYVLHVEHISFVITNCGQHQWVIPSPLSIALSALLEQKHDQKITIPIFRLVLQNFAIPSCFPCILFYRYLSSLLSSGWFVIAICGSISVQGTSKVFRIIVNWRSVAISNEKST